MRIIEFFGGPGSGKTTTATHAFSAFKQMGIECEFVREYAQEAIYCGQKHHLDSQFIVAANQYRKYKEQELAGTKLVFSDTSMLLSKVYGDITHPGRQYLNALIDILQDEFEIVKVFIKRVKEYKTQGRLQTEQEARELDILMKSKCGPFDFAIPGDEQGIKSLLGNLNYVS